MKRRISYPIYLLIKALVRLFYGKMSVEGAENLPEGPCIIVGNHTQMNGPICCELFLPVQRYTWCAGEMMSWRDCAGYAYRDFWSRKPKRVRWLFKIASCLIVPIAVVVFRNADTIPVYHDQRILTTFRTTVQKLQEGSSVVIFPEHDVPGNHILYEFQQRFVDVARLYCKKSKQDISFVPMYIAPDLRKIVFGAPIPFDPTADRDAERERICHGLFDSITQMAVALPRHRVVPYRNMPRKLYPYNKP